MRISKDRPGRGKAFRATTGEELVALLARKDRDAEKSVSRPVAVMEEERDETGALQAGGFMARRADAGLSRCLRIWAMASP